MERSIDRERVVSNKGVVEERVGSDSVKINLTDSEYLVILDKYLCSGV